MKAEILILIISSLAWVVGLLVTIWTHAQYKIDIVVSPLSELPSDSPPLISIIVPARNEARNIRRSVTALLSQTYPNYELIVVNDRSTDATASILTELQKSIPKMQDLSDPRKVAFRVVEAGKLPAGWAGKPHALVQGVAAAHGDWLCFVDADTFATPQLLSATYACAQDYNADLFTILTDQELVGFWEKVIQPVVFTALSVGFPARRVNDPTQPDAIANGQFIMIRRSVYEAVGGHSAVAGRIVEDKALAELVKHRGYRLILADGRAIARTRMYASFQQIWEGWTKNIFLGMEGHLGLLLQGVVVGLSAALLFPAWLVGALIWLVISGGWVAALVSAQTVLFWGFLFWLRLLAARSFHISPLYAFTLPLGTLVSTAMMLASAYQVLSGRGVTWKGRRYT